MKRARYLALVAVVSLVGCARATPEQEIVDAAATALGGAERILGAKTLAIEGRGTQYNLGQDVVPGASGQTFTVTSFTRHLDVAGERARTTLTREPNFTYFQGPAPQTQVTGIDGEVGYNVAPSGTATRVADAAAADRRAELFHHPLTAVRAALDPMATLANARTEGGESLVDVTTASGQRFTLAVDSATSLPSRVTTMTYNVNLGDVAISTSFEDYEETNGWQLPTRLTTRTDDFTTTEIQVSTQSVDGATGDLAAPEAAASAPAVGAPPPAMVTAETLAPGIWLLAGGSHHSVLVEFADHLMLIEAPLNDARTLAVIAKAREQVPGKPLTQLVNTHHHFDHSGGIRAAISEGLTIITHSGNVALFEELAGRPHTIVADALAANPRPATIEGVDDRRTISDGKMTVDLYAVSGAHSETMLVAHFPRERLLVQVDVYTPGGAVQMFAGGLLEALKTRKLRIDRIVPLHGTVVPYAQFVKEASTPVPGR
jgi:glyoxylase-like metal-dependent hydrolase (beta-lactamase superfamily II)